MGHLGLGAMVVVLSPRTSRGVGTLSYLVSCFPSLQSKPHKAHSAAQASRFSYGRAMVRLRSTLVLCCHPNSGLLSCGASVSVGGPGGSRRQSTERVGAELEMEGNWNGVFAAFFQPRRPVSACRPHPA